MSTATLKVSTWPLIPSVDMIRWLLNLFISVDQLCSNLKKQQQQQQQPVPCE